MQKRDGFTSSIGVTLATLGSAVGLGNIWKVPYLTGMNGGASFLVMYIMCTFVVGLPIMIAEILIGRHVKANAVESYRKLSPKGQPWFLIGVIGVLGAFTITAYYSGVAGWVFAYVYKSFAALITGGGVVDSTAMFNDLVTDPAQAVFWQYVVLVTVGLVIMMGVSKGIEGTVKRLMPVLFVLLVALGIRSMTLPGASAGLSFLFSPDFSKIDSNVILMALGLAFFKMSIGMGIMTTYGSYYRDDQNVPFTTLQVMLADLTVSILAGVAIFPAVFAFGMEPAAGPSLLFLTIPEVFKSMPLGNFFQLLFFVLAAVASLGAMLSLLEVPVAFITEQTGWSRKAGTSITVGLLMLFGAPAALSSSVAQGWHIFGMNPFDFYDYLSSNLLLPLDGIAICVFAAWVWGKKPFSKAFSNNGQLQNGTIAALAFGLLKYVSPVLILIILFKGLGVF